MSWVKVDDKYEANRKIRRAWRKERASLGLHVMAMSHSALFETDGLVDADWVEEMLPDAEERARVVAVMLSERLFVKLPAGEKLTVRASRVRRGEPVELRVTHGPLEEDAYVVHDYLEFNEAREEAADRRREAAERKTRSRQKTSRGSHEPVTPESHVTHSGVTVESAVSHSPVTAESLCSTRPDPTRPDPVENQDSLRDRSELVSLADRLATRMRANDPKARISPASNAWLDPLRLLLDLDHRTVEEVELVIDWCQTDEFWRTNVLSPSKLREQFARLFLQMKESKGAVGSSARQERRARGATALGALLAEQEAA